MYYMYILYILYILYIYIYIYIYSYIYRYIFLGYIWQYELFGSSLYTTTLYRIFCVDLIICRYFLLRAQVNLCLQVEKNLKHDSRNQRRFNFLIGIMFSLNNFFLIFRQQLVSIFLPSSGKPKLDCLLIFR